MSQRSLEQLTRQLHELKDHVQHFEISNERVSAANVGWHIEHSLLVIDGVIESLSKSDPSTFKAPFNLKKIIIYLLGKFPRGKARAPKSVRPKTEVYSQEELSAHVETSTKNVPSLYQLEPKAYFKHPIFGNLALNDSIRFLEMHTEHHLRIIRAILA